jgi:Na+/pantothenate symporter
MMMRGGMARIELLDQVAKPSIDDTATAITTTAAAIGGCAVRGGGGQAFRKLKAQIIVIACIQIAVFAILAILLKKGFSPDQLSSSQPNNSPLQQLSQPQSNLSCDC